MIKILLVEDDIVLQKMYLDKFVHEGFDVAVASDGGEGLSKMKSFHPDMVVLDLLLPTMTGFEVVDMAKNDPLLRDIPIIVLTNIFADGEDLVKNKGVKSFLLKSNVTPDDVVKKIRALLSA